MIIDLRKLYSLKKIEINQNIIIPSSFYQNLDIIEIKEVKVSGYLKLGYEMIELNLDVNGIFVMPCSISLEETDVAFNTTIDTIIAESQLKNQFNLDLLDILWENIVLEVPLNVIKEGIEIKNIKKDNWQFLEEEN